MSDPQSGNLNSDQCRDGLKDNQLGAYAQFVIHRHPFQLNSLHRAGQSSQGRSLYGTVERVDDCFGEMTEVRHVLALLHSTVHPDIEAVFQKLANLKLYKVDLCVGSLGRELRVKELIEFLNKWQETQFEKCINGIRNVVEKFQSRIAQDSTSHAEQDMQKFLKAGESLNMLVLICV